MIQEFLGFERPKGLVGIRNKVMILSSVVCVNHVAQEISKKVDNSIAITHPLGCGQFAIDFTNIQRTLSGLAANPNIYGVLIVGLGCENMKSDALAKIVKRSKKPVEFFDVQDVQGGTIAAIEKGINIAIKFSSEANHDKVNSENKTENIITRIATKI